MHVSTQDFPDSCPDVAPRRISYRSRGPSPRTCIASTSSRITNCSHTNKNTISLIVANTNLDNKITTSANTPSSSSSRVGDRTPAAGAAKPPPRWLASRPASCAPPRGWTSATRPRPSRRRRRRRQSATTCASHSRSAINPYSTSSSSNNRCRIVTTSPRRPGKIDDRRQRIATQIYTARALPLAEVIEISTLSR